MNSTSESSGHISITLTFEAGTDPDMAQVQVQNRLSQAQSSLPEVVQGLGVTVMKTTASFLKVVALTSKSGNIDEAELGDYLVSNVQEQLKVLAKCKSSAQPLQCVFGSTPRNFISTL